jgi:hypothetical protein
MAVSGVRKINRIFELIAQKRPFLEGLWVCDA